jgi:hypothetical protein
MQKHVMKETKLNIHKMSKDLTGNRNSNNEE